MSDWMLSRRSDFDDGEVTVKFSGAFGEIAMGAGRFAQDLDGFEGAGWGEDGDGVGGFEHAAFCSGCSKDRTYQNDVLRELDYFNMIAMLGPSFGVFACVTVISPP